MTDLERLLSISNLAQLRAEVSAGKPPAGPAQAQQVAAHARTLAAAAKPLRVAFVHTYTSDLLDPWLNLAGALQGLEVQAYHAPYGLALQEAASDSALVQHQPHATVLLLQREDLHPGLSRPIVGLDVAAQAALRTQALERVREIVGLWRAQKVGHVVLTFLPAIANPALGLYDTQAQNSEAAWWAGFKAELGAWMRSVPAALFLDLDDTLLQVGRAQFFDRRFWYSSRYPFASEAARLIARSIVGIGVVLASPRAKVLVLDADNTMWGGVVGEDGFDGIKLGPDYPGNIFVDFQRRILDFQQRGLILAMCSKNNAADVAQVLEQHPHQVLRDEHFAARRVNWVTKPENLKSLAEELNLGLDSFIFVDDSDHECAAVRHALPQVEVVQVPSRLIDIPRCLDAVARLEVLALTSEDLAKTEMYAQERKRRELLESAGSGAAAGGSAGGNASDYLSRLGMKMTLQLGAKNHVPRLSQLTQKTNQFNLTTRRYDEQQIQAFMQRPDWVVADFSLADTFGDSGIVGLALIELQSPKRALVDTFLMSCRVIGRQAEAAFLHALFRHLHSSGVEEVIAEFVPSAKNELVKMLLPEQGFEAMADGRWRRDLRTVPPKAESDFPITIYFSNLGVAASS